jgi:hypothetical protein
MLSISNSISGWSKEPQAIFALVFLGIVFYQCQHRVVVVTSSLIFLAKFYDIVAHVGMIMTISSRCLVSPQKTIIFHHNNHLKRIRGPN